MTSFDNDEDSQPGPEPTGRFRLPRLTLSRRFGIVLLLVVPLVAAVCVIGGIGVQRMNDEVEGLYEKEYVQTLTSSKLSRSLSAAETATLRLLQTNVPRLQEQLTASLDRRLLPAVDVALRRVRAGGDPSEKDEARELSELATRWRGFERLLHSEAFAQTRPTARSEALDDRLAGRVTAFFDDVVGQADGLVDEEAVEARGRRDQAERQFKSTLGLLVGASVLALLGTLGVIAWLIRGVVPRARDYSRFAASVAEGKTEARVDPAGRDELTDLGVLLNGMVSHRESEQRRIDQQAEFSEAMQITESEREAYELLKRHLERSIAAADLAVLSRNNSADRLEPRTAIDANDSLVERLKDARPRSCMAVRTGEQQSHGEGREPLLECEVCGGLGPSACQPLLVGGEVLGSVLALRDGALDEEECEAMRVSVAQAAPILANLRNLAIAEERAGTDELTGLANQRAGSDAVKRLVADATRSGEPLGAIVLDLDHFKQVNDKFGHAAGDEVLAAVGVTLRTTLHETDFCARWGGEEFLILLPQTTAQGTQTAAENIRGAVARIRVPTVERLISASLGVAALPLHAIDADGLVRSADRALYMAKAAGRNRVEMIETSEPDDHWPAGPTDAELGTSAALLR